MSQSIPTGLSHLRAILNAVAILEDVPADVIRFGPGVRSVVLARQRFMAEAYDTGKWSLPQIGAFLDRDHSTVWHGVRAHKARATA